MVNKSIKFESNGKILQYLFRITSLLFGFAILIINFEIPTLLNRQLFIFSIVIFILYNILFLKFFDSVVEKTIEKRFYFIILLDLIVAVAAILITGGLKSPFIYYSLSPVLLAGYYGGYISVSVTSFLMTICLYLVNYFSSGISLFQISSQTMRELFQTSFYYFLSGYLITFLAKIYIASEKTTERYKNAKSQLEKISLKNESINKKFLILLGIYEEFQKCHRLNQLFEKILTGSIVLGYSNAILGVASDGNSYRSWIRLSENGEFQRFLYEKVIDIDKVYTEYSKEFKSPLGCPKIMLFRNLSEIGLDYFNIGLDNDKQIIISISGKHNTKCLLILFTKREIDFKQELIILSSYITEVNLALDSLEKHEVLVKQIQMLESLNEVATAVSSKLTLESILNTVVEKAKEIINAEKVVLSLMDISGQQEQLDPKYFTVRGKKDQYPEEWWRHEMEVLAIDVIKTGKSRIISIRTDKKSEDRAWLLCVPIKVKDKSLGVISVLSSSSDYFEIVDVLTIETLGKFAAVAVENVNLVQKSLESVISEERGRIARDMHDGLAQSLFSIILNLQILESMIKKDSSTVNLKLREIKSFTQQNLTQLRNYIYNLQPPDVNRYGLTKALQMYLDQTSKISDIDISFNVEGNVVNLASRTEISIYRMIQEATSNVIRHSDASLLKVNLLYEKNYLLFILEDNGKGFEPKELSESGEDYNGMGLNNIRKRIENFGGSLVIDSKPGKGTRIYTEIPI